MLRIPDPRRPRPSCASRRPNPPRTARLRALRRLRRLPAAVVVGIVLVIAGCGGSSPTGTTGDGGTGGGGGGPATITVTPSTVPAGGGFRIDGASVDPSDVAAWRLRVGPEVAPFRVMPDGSIEALAPLFLPSDTSTTPAPPAGALDVVLERGGAVSARADGALTVTPLPPAPGTAQRMVADLATIAEALDSLFARLPPVDPRVDGARAAAIGALHGLISGADSSLQAVLDGTSSWAGASPDVSLADAILAASGAADYASQLAGAFAPVLLGVRAPSPGAGARERASLGAMCRGSGADFDLACLMQIYTLLDDYTQQFVSPTAQTWGNTMGLAAGLVALSGYAVPGTVIVGAILTTMDYVMSKVVPALLPSHVTQFELTVNRPRIPVGLLTDTEIRISAANTPSKVTVNDMVDVILADMGLAGESQLASSFTDVLLNAVQFAIDLYRSILREYNNLHPGTFNELDFTTMTLSWGPTVVEHADLVELYSFQPNIAQADEPAFEWRGVSPGTARIQGRGRAAGDRAKVLRDHALCLGCVYSGGAWGNDAPATNVESQEVSGVLLEWVHTHANGATVTGTVRACSIDSWQVDLAVAGIVGGAVISGSGSATFAADTTGLGETEVTVTGSAVFGADHVCTYTDPLTVRVQMNADWTTATVFVSSTGAGSATCQGVTVPGFAVVTGEETQVTAQSLVCTARRGR